MGVEKTEADVKFGARLKEARDDAGLSTLELAEKLFLTRESVDRYMRGERRPSQDLVAQWEDLCGLATGSLVDDYARLPLRRVPPTDAAAAAPPSATPQSDAAPGPDSKQPAAVDHGQPDGVAPAGDVGGELACDDVASGALRGRLWALGVATLAATLLAGATGLLVGHSFRPSLAPDRPTSLATTSDVELRVPASWLPATREIAPPGLGLANVTVFAADRPRGAGMMAGISEATGAALLLPRTLRRLDRQPRQDVGERLGNIDAYRYAGMRVRDFAGRVTLFVAPTSIGVLTLVCFTPGRDTAQLRESCRSIARSVRLLRGDSYPLGPSRRYQERINGALASLDGTRRRDRAALVTARTAQGQAVLADRLGAAFAVAHARAGGFGVSPRESGDHRRFLRALKTTSEKYGRLASAARRESRPLYSRAAREVARAERRVRAAMRALGRLGYP